MNKLSAVRSIAAAAVLLVASTTAFAGSSSLKLVNKSDWEIHHIYVSSAADGEWGPDQLEDETLSSGGSLTLTGIGCDLYDIKVVDEEGTECIIAAADLCENNSYWLITNDDLESCESE